MKTGIDNMDKIVSDVVGSSLNSSELFKMESVTTSSNSYESTTSSMNIPEISTPVLGRFSGIFAKLDSMSVNKRFYSADFWRKILARPKTKSDLTIGRMIGIFEHPNVMSDYTKEGIPTARHPMNGAFIVKRLWIEGSNVMGEAYILNTPMGRLLATYFLAKDKFGKPLVELSISVRGYSREDYFDSNGVDVMNPNDYVFQSFDVVMNPGIKGALVKMESKDDLDTSLNEKNESYDYSSRDDLYKFLHSPKVESITNEVNEYSLLSQELINELKLKTV